MTKHRRPPEDPLGLGDEDDLRNAPPAPTPYLLLPDHYISKALARVADACTGAGDTYPWAVEDTAGSIASAGPSAVEALHWFRAYHADPRNTDSATYNISVIVGLDDVSARVQYRNEKLARSWDAGRGRAERAIRDMRLRQRVWEIRRHSNQPDRAATLLHCRVIRGTAWADPARCLGSEDEHTRVTAQVYCDPARACRVAARILADMCAAGHLRRHRFFAYAPELSRALLVADSPRALDEIPSTGVNLLVRPGTEPSALRGAALAVQAMRTLVFYENQRRALWDDIAWVRSVYRAASAVRTPEDAEAIRTAWSAVRTDALTRYQYTNVLYVYAYASLRQLCTSLDAQVPEDGARDWARNVTTALDALGARLYWLLADVVAPKPVATLTYAIISALMEIHREDYAHTTDWRARLDRDMRYWEASAAPVESAGAQP